MSEEATTPRELPSQQEVKGQLYYMDFAFKHLSPDEAGPQFALMAFNPKLVNIALHCAKAGLITKFLSDEMGVEDQAPIIKAAILHDENKQREIQLYLQAHGWGIEPRDRHKWAKDQETDARHRSDALHTSDEVLTLREAVVPKTIHGPETLPEMIVWYSDATLSGTKIVDIEQRMSAPIDLDNVRGQRARGMDRYYEDKYGYGGREFREVQIGIGKRVSAVFLELIAGRNIQAGITPPTDITSLLRERMREEVARFDFKQCLDELSQREKDLGDEDYSGRTHLTSTKAAFHCILNPDEDINLDRAEKLTSQDLLTMYEDLE